MKTNTQNIARKIFFLFSFFYFLNTNAQAPEKMSYQAVIRNASNALVANANVGIKISILQGTATGTVVYAERQTPTTNANGLATIQIGSGTVLSGAMATIDWGAGPYFIKTETDPTGGTNYTITSTTQLMSVPYALNSKTTSAVSGANFYVPRFSSNNTLTNSSIFDTGNVGIGTIQPVAKLDVNGQILTRNRMVFGPTPTGDPEYDPIWAIDNSNNNFRIFNQPNISSSGSTYLSIAPSGNTTLNGYTKLGNDAPAIKMKYITGTTGASQGDQLGIGSGLPSNTQIIGLSAQVQINNGTWIQPGFASTSGWNGYEYYAYVYNHSIFLKNSPNNSNDILSRPFKILITYIE